MKWVSAYNAARKGFGISIPALIKRDIYIGYNGLQWFMDIQGYKFYFNWAPNLSGRADWHVVAFCDEHGR